VAKPQSITSTDVLRSIQHHFDQSPIFKPLLDSQRQEENTKFHKKRRHKKLIHKVKAGHGGTLDPLATGVVVVGIGNGTKSLQNFIGCQKTYETVVLFGVESDSYDVLGKVTKTTGWEGVTKESVSEALKKFKGTIMQRPPTFSARWHNGVRLYDMARRGEEIPEELLKPKEMVVNEMELLDFQEAGSHNFAMRTGEELAKPLIERPPDELRRGQVKQRKRKEREDAEESERLAKEAKISESTSKADGTEAAAMADIGTESQDAEPKEDLKTTSELAPADATETEAPPPPLGPIARIRMTVSSGFYVRSLCHDLGKELNSSGVMAELARTRQGPFQLGSNVLKYEDLEKGEEVWGPQVTTYLQDWMDGKVKL